MNRTTLTTALAALTVIGGAALTSATAADFDGDSRTYGGYERGYPQPANQDYRRRVPDNFDEDDDGRGRRHGGWNRPGHIHRVDARASYASDYLPYHVKEWRARHSAIDAWKWKVTNQFGEPFAHWRTAEDKRVDCDAGAGTITCTVSARPVRGGPGWGWSGWGRNASY